MDDNEGISVSGYLTDLLLVFKHEIFFQGIHIFKFKLW